MNAPQAEIAALSEASQALEKVQAKPSRFNPYPKYRASGVDWLGELPLSWTAKRLKYMCSRSALYGANIPADKYVRDGIRFLRTSDITDDGELRTDSPVFVEPEDVQGYELSDDDLLISRSGTLGRSFIYDHSKHGPCAYAGYLVRFVPSKNLLSAFAFYFTQSLPFMCWIDQETIAATIGNVNGQKYANLYLPAPPIKQQWVIATFLDRETKKIDSLIAKKRRLIELLKEKRTALISHAVTKGLNPDAPMKPTGIDWIGEVPKHWDVRRVKYVVGKIGSGKTPRGGSERYVSDGVMLLRSQNIYDDGLRLNDVVFIDDNTDAEMANSRTRDGDVLLNITGASIGRCAVIPPETRAGNVNQHVCIIRPTKIHSHFLHAIMCSKGVKDWIAAEENGTSREGLNFQQIRRMPIPVPPSPEQCAIIGHLDNETQQLDRLAGRIEQAIAKLREYRSALISAAVTGKIDVRGEV